MKTAEARAAPAHGRKQKPSCEGCPTTRSCQRDRKFPGGDGVREHCAKFRRGRVTGERRRPGGRTADVMSDLSAARTTTRAGQCRESRARRTHEFARSAGRAARTKPITHGCQP